MILGEEIKLKASDGKKRTHVVVKCDCCETLFPKIKKNIGRYANHYCSKRCTHKGAENKVTIQCDNCGKDFQRKPSQIKKLSNYCSSECKNFAQSHGGDRQLRCGSDYGPASHRRLALAKHGEKCEICQYDDIANLLDSHHIDHDRTNFDVDNLMVLCVMCHAAETRKIIRINTDRSVEPIGDKGSRFLKQLGE